MNRRNFRSLRSWALSGAAIAAIASPAYAEDARRFEIPQQSLIAALEAFGKQGDKEILFSRSAAEGRSTGGVVGDYEPAQALSMLLDGSGLRYRQVNANTYVVEAADPQGGSAAGDGAEGTVEALIVTAQKREEDIQDVPIAISAFTQEDLTRSQVAGGPDLITQVPNMTFTKTNFSSYSVQIRGIGTQAISATTDPAVAVAFNNTPFIRNRFFEQEFYDLQRVEVLRGPQGTLYGRNATAGVVNIISAKPKFSFEAKASGDVSNYNSSRLEGMINVPLVEDIVALRLAGAWTKREGYATNELNGNPIDGRDLWSTRLSLRIAPTDRLDANLIWEHFEEDDDRLRSGKQLCKKHVVDQIGELTNLPYFTFVPDNGQTAGISTIQSVFSQGCLRNSLYSPDSFQTPNGQSIPYYYQLGAVGLPIALSDPYASEVQSPDLRVIESTLDPEYRAKTDLAEIQVAFDLTGNLTLQSETAYLRDVIFSTQDFNRFNTAPGAWRTHRPNGEPYPAFERGALDEDGFFCDPQVGCSNRLVAQDLSTAKSTHFSQEFRLASGYEGPFNFSIGANFLRYDTEDKYYVFINSLSLIAARSLHANYALPYEAGVTDNIDCMFNGYVARHPDDVSPVTNCIYIDPNPIDNLNDQGHNYFLSRNPFKLISYAVFGEAYYNITDVLKVTAGLRWSVDKKEAPRIPSQTLTSNTVGYPVAEVIEQEWREPTGRLVVDWKPDLAFTDETLLYASYAHGYKAGGANPPGFAKVYYAEADIARTLSENSLTRPKTFEPEFVDAFELGAKNTLLDGALTVNTAAFYYDYQAYQISEIVDRSAFNRNFDAEVWGVEVEADWRPLENLRLGFKGGYEKTRVADGEEAIDLMDRTAGMPGWSVVRPFPTQASSCILPTWLYFPTALPSYPSLFGLGNPNGGGPGGCELAYLENVDPVTYLPYVADPTVSNGQSLSNWDDYPGWNPETAPNNGEGFAKQLGGNELPNAPNWTATITADYTLPLPNEWLATLHTDLHWQSESWWRVFNDHEFNRLDEYFTMNLAAIFTNEEAGWNIMAYIKNVTDETAITGAFLNSDDTGLTTNVFLTEPRLYGLRVTKAWTGDSPFGTFGQRHDGPYALTVELGGQVQKHEAPTSIIQPTFTDEFAPSINIFDEPQNEELDWGDGRDMKVTWRPGDRTWNVSAGVRYGRTNGTRHATASEESESACIFGTGYLAFLCALYKDHPVYGEITYLSELNQADADIRDRERHQLVDFTVGRDFGLGGLSRSTVGVGIRYADFESQTLAGFYGVPDWFVPEGFATGGGPVTHTLFRERLNVQRDFEGLGPVLSWEAAFPIFERDTLGRVDVDWSVTAGVLKGDQSVAISGRDEAFHYAYTNPFSFISNAPTPAPFLITNVPVQPVERSEDVSVPLAGLTLGLSYEVDRFRIGAGYRWERYYDVIDGGADERREEDRTIDGPYFKLSVGFGG